MHLFPNPTGKKKKMNKNSHSINEFEEPPIHYIRFRGLNVSFHKGTLQSKEDVDEFIEVLRLHMTDIVNQGKRIAL